MEKLSYEELSKKQQEEVNNLPIYWAFGQEQINELIKKLDFKNEDELKENVFTIGAGSIILKKDKEKILNTFKKHNEEIKKAFEDDDFLQGAFEYELANHEYIITYNIYDTLIALNISNKEYQESERLQRIAKKAIENYTKHMEELGW